MSGFTVYIALYVSAVKYLYLNISYFLGINDYIMAFSIVVILNEIILIILPFSSYQFWHWNFLYNEKSMIQILERSYDFETCVSNFQNLVEYICAMNTLNR